MTADTRIGIVYVSTSSTIAEPTIDLSYLRDTFDNSDEIKAEKLRKKLLRIRSLGK